MGNKNDFRKTWKTLTELGQEFGVSAVKFGNLLKQHGLREKDGEPSQIAKDSGFIEKISPKEGKSYYLWHRGKTSEYLISQGVAKNGVSAKDALKMTEARKLARSYMEAQKLDDEGSKLGYMMLSEMVDDIKKIGLEPFNQALKSIGYKGDEVTLEGW
jgi:ABC-type nitrate/sulfonate/bicarbonate transport system substrate-binding protein